MIRWIKVIARRVLLPAGAEAGKAKDSVVIRKFNSREVSRLLYFRRMFDLVGDVQGDVVECGVAFGWSLLALCFLAKDEQKGRKIWAFDSFEGFPEPSTHDSGVSLEKQAYEAASVESVTKFLGASGLERDFIHSQITFVKGFFNESLDKYRGGPIAFLHLDGDLYESYRDSLEQMFPKMATGGVVLFDEYMGNIDNIKWPGAQKAIDEYFGEKKSEICRDSASGKYYLVKR